MAPAHAWITLLIVGLLGPSLACGDDLTAPADDVLADLRATPGVELVEVFPDDAASGQRYFDIWLTQPADHANPSGATFRQYGALILREPQAAGTPTVLYTSGYDAGWRRRRGAVAEMVDGNQLSLDYRFYGESFPAPRDYALLTVAQASADFHSVTMRLRPVLEGPWLHTGGSKGGETVLHSAYFYPGDVDGRLAFVTPVRLGNPDERFAGILNEIGTPSCRAALRATQLEIATRRDAMKQRAAAEGSFNALGVDYAVETAFVELEWSFWQYLGVAYCPQVPTAPAMLSDDELWAFFDFVSSPLAYGDEEYATYASFIYQAMAELGYPRLTHGHLGKLTQYDYQDLTPFLPAEVPTAPTLDPTFNQALLAWANGSASHLRVVDGQWDPWVAGAVQVSGLDASRFEVSQASHWSASIATLAPADQADVLTAIEAWTGVTPTLPALRPAEAGIPAMHGADFESTEAAPAFYMPPRHRRHGRPWAPLLHDF